METFVYPNGTSRNDQYQADLKTCSEGVEAWANYLTGNYRFRVMLQYTFSMLANKVHVQKIKLWKPVFIYPRNI